MSSEKESLLTDDINDEYGINENEKDQFINRVKLLGFAKSIKLWAGIEFLYDIYLTFSLSWVYIFFRDFPCISEGRKIRESTLMQRALCFHS